MASDSDIVNNLRNLQSQVTFLNEKTRDMMAKYDQKYQPNDSFSPKFLTFQNIKIFLFIVYPIFCFVLLYFYQPEFVMCEEKIPGTFFVEKKIDISLVLAYTFGSYLFICLMYYIYISKVSSKQK